MAPDLAPEPANAFRVAPRPKLEPLDGYEAYSRAIALVDHPERSFGEQEARRILEGLVRAARRPPDLTREWQMMRDVVEAAVAFRKYPTTEPGADLHQHIKTLDAAVDALLAEGWWPVGGSVKESTHG